MPAMQHAFELVRGGMTYRQAAKEAGVSTTTLFRQMREGDWHERRLGAPPKLNLKTEEWLANWVLSHARINNAITVDMFNTKAAEVFATLGDATVKGGRSWRRGFYRRYPLLSNKIAENTELARVVAMHPTTLQRWFDFVEPFVQTTPASMFFNLDEVGVDLLNQRSRVRARARAGGSDRPAPQRETRPNASIVELHLFRR